MPDRENFNNNDENTNKPGLEKKGFLNESNKQWIKQNIEKALDQTKYKKLLVALKSRGKLAKIKQNLEQKDDSKNNISETQDASGETTYEIVNSSRLSFGKQIAHLNAKAIQIISPANKAGIYQRAKNGEYYKITGKSLSGSRFKFYGGEKFKIHETNSFKEQKIKVVPEIPVETYQADENTIIEKAREFTGKINSDNINVSVVQKVIPGARIIGTYLSVAVNNNFYEREISSPKALLNNLEEIANTVNYLRYLKKNKPNLQNFGVDFRLNLDPKHKEITLQTVISPKSGKKEIKNYQNPQDILEDLDKLKVSDTLITRLNNVVKQTPGISGSILVVNKNGNIDISPNLKIEGVKVNENNLFPDEEIKSSETNYFNLANQIFERSEKILKALPSFGKKIKKEGGKITGIEIQNLLVSQGEAAAYINFTAKDKTEKTVKISLLSNQNKDYANGVNLTYVDERKKEIDTPEKLIASKNGEYLEEKKLSKDDLEEQREISSMRKKAQEEILNLLSEVSVNGEHIKSAIRVDYEPKSKNLILNIDGKLGKINLNMSGNLSYYDFETSFNLCKKRLKSALHLFVSEMNNYGIGEKELLELKITNLANPNKNTDLIFKEAIIKNNSIIQVSQRKINIWSGKEKDLNENLEVRLIKEKANKQCSKAVKDGLGDYTPDFENIANSIVYNPKTKKYTISISGTINSTKFDTGKIEFSYYDFETPFDKFITKVKRAIGVYAQIKIRQNKDEYSTNAKPVKLRENKIEKISLFDLANENSSGKMVLEMSSRDIHNEDAEIIKTKAIVTNLSGFRTNIQYIDTPYTWNESAYDNGDKGVKLEGKSEAKRLLPVAKSKKTEKNKA